MAGTLIEDNAGDGRSSSTEDMPSDQQSHSGDSLAEWRSSEQVENGTPSTSPAYSDTDDDDCGPRPSELYGKFTWRIDNFSQINKRELRSNSFDVGGFKWYGLCMGMNWTHYFLFILYSTAYIFLLCCIFASYLPARYDLAVSFQ